MAASAVSVQRAAVLDVYPAKLGVVIVQPLGLGQRTTIGHSQDDPGTRLCQQQQQNGNDRPEQHLPAGGRLMSGRPLDHVLRPRRIDLNRIPFDAEAAPGPLTEPADPLQTLISPPPMVAGKVRSRW